MRESVEKTVGYGIGCAIVGGLALAALAAIALLAVAFPITLSIVLATIAVLAFIEWRRRRTKALQVGRAPDHGSSANRSDDEG